MQWFRQLFCRHCWVDITTEYNLQVEVSYWECKKCHKLIGCWEFHV